MNRLDWNEVYCVSEQRDLADDTVLDQIRRWCGALPIGYAEFTKTLGFGTLDSFVALRPCEIEDSVSMVRRTLQWWAESSKEFGHPLIIPENAVDDAIALATTDWGEYFFCSPSDPGVLWYIDRPDDWGEATTFLPLGFANPFFHQGADGSTFYDDDFMKVFHPARSAQSIQLLVNGRTYQTKNRKSVDAIVHVLKEFFEITHDVVWHDVHHLYSKAIGAEVRVGYRHHQRCAFLYAVVDAEHSKVLNRLTSFVSNAGFIVSDHPQ